MLIVNKTTLYTIFLFYSPEKNAENCVGEGDIRRWFRAFPMSASLQSRYVTSSQPRLVRV